MGITSERSAVSPLSRQTKPEKRVYEYQPAKEIQSHPSVIDAPTPPPVAKRKPGRPRKNLEAKKPTKLRAAERLIVVALRMAAKQTNRDDLRPEYAKLADKIEVGKLIISKP